ncbi:hypothetical protein ACOME3_007507 [Neoechinorhynchus agilis]
MRIFDDQERRRNKFESPIAVNHFDYWDMRKSLLVKNSPDGNRSRFNLTYRAQLVQKIERLKRKRDGGRGLAEKISELQVLIQKWRCVAQRCARELYEKHRALELKDCLTMEAMLGKFEIPHELIGYDVESQSFIVQ